MTNQTIAQHIIPAEFGNVVDAVTQELRSGNSGLQMSGVKLASGAFEKSVAEAVENALSISLLDALLEGWRGVKTLASLIGRAGPMDGKKRVAALANHKIKLAYRPQIQVRLGESVDLRTISLPVILEIAAAGVVLTVRNREIIKATAGHLAPKLIVRVEKVKVVETTLPQIDLSGDFLSPAPKTAELHAV